MALIEKISLTRSENKKRKLGDSINKKSPNLIRKQGRISIIYDFAEDEKPLKPRYENGEEIRMRIGTRLLD